MLKTIFIFRIWIPTVWVRLFILFGGVQLQVISCWHLDGCPLLLLLLPLGTTLEERSKKTGYLIIKNFRTILLSNCSMHKIFFFLKYWRFLLYYVLLRTHIWPNHSLLWWQIYVKILYVNRISLFSRCLNGTFPWRNCSDRTLIH